MDTRNEWLESPPGAAAPFYPAWVWDGERVALANWIDGEWRTGGGVVYDETKITHYQHLRPPTEPRPGE